MDLPEHHLTPAGPGGDPRAGPPAGQAEPPPGGTGASKVNSAASAIASARERSAGSWRQSASRPRHARHHRPAVIVTAGRRGPRSRAGRVLIAVIGAPAVLGIDAATFGVLLVALATVTRFSAPTAWRRPCNVAVGVGFQLTPGPGRAGALLLPDGVAAGGRLARAGPGVEPGHPSRRVRCPVPRRVRPVPGCITYCCRTYVPGAGFSGGNFALPSVCGACFISPLRSASQVV